LEEKAQVSTFKLQDTRGGRLRVEDCALKLGRKGSSFNIQASRYKGQLRVEDCALKLEYFFREGKAQVSTFKLQDTRGGRLRVEDCALKLEYFLAPS